MILLLFVTGACQEDAIDTTGAIYGKVTDSESGEVLQDVTITLTPGGLSRTTGSEGTYEFIELESQQYQVQAQKDGYVTNSKSVRVLVGQAASGDMRLTPEKRNAEISLTPSSLNFGNTQEEMSVTITNNGNTETEWTLELGSSNWLTANPKAGRIGSKKTQSVVFAVDRDKLGEAKSVVVNLSAFGNSYPISISCSPNNAKTPQMSVSPTTLDFGSVSQEQNLEIKNTGEADLNWTIKGISSDCISVSESEGTIAPAGKKIVRVKLDRSKMEGDLNATFVISDGTKEESVTITAVKGVPITGTTIPEGMYVYYKFDNDFNDATENAVHGFGLNTPSFVTGVDADSKAVKFNRTNNSSFVVPKPIIDSRDMTICFWGKDFGDGNIFYMLSNNGNQPMFTLSMKEGTLKFVVTRYDNGYCYAETGNFMHPTLTDGRWHHIALTSDFNKTTFATITTNLYIDGQLVDVVTEGANPFTEADGDGRSYGSGIKFIMGGSVKLSSSNILNGTNMVIDNFRVYDTRRLSADEIKYIYDAKQ